jgi:hypothetical protein
MSLTPLQALKDKITQLASVLLGVKMLIDGLYTKLAERDLALKIKADENVAIALRFDGLQAQFADLNNRVQQGLTVDPVEVDDINTLLDSVITQNRALAYDLTAHAHETQALHADIASEAQSLAEAVVENTPVAPIVLPAGEVIAPDETAA